VPGQTKEKQIKPDSNSDSDSDELQTFQCGFICYFVIVIIIVIVMAASWQQIFPCVVLLLSVLYVFCKLCDKILSEAHDLLRFFLYSYARCFWVEVKSEAEAVDVVSSLSFSHYAIEFALLQMQHSWR